MADKIVRALDLGSGWAKLNRIVNGKLEYMSFPSLAPRHAGRDLSMSLIGKRDTVVVNVEGTQYEVGPDSADLDANDSTRNLNDGYIYSDQYKAVLYGALHYMGEETIDLLVVGLPLTTIHRAPDLKNMVVGTHRLNETTTVTVKDALVLPQPMGGLYYCLSQAVEREEFEFMREENNLIIDIGYLTYDFLVCNGDKINDARSNAHPGGVSKVLRAITESISNKFGIKYDNLAAVDKAIERRRIKINGKAEGLDEHIRYAKPALEGSVNFMRNIAGDGSDIDNIILFGGGQNLFAKTILNHYRSHTVIALGEDAQYANVKGYQAAGEKHAGAKPVPRANSELPELKVMRYEAPPAPAASAPAAATAPAQAQEPADADI